MKFWKILAPIAVCLVLVLVLLPAEANAATEGNYTYTVTAGKATITQCSTSISGHVTIPATLGGYPVTAIGDGAFDFCDDMLSVTFPDTLVTIGDEAFQWCSGLTSLTIPEGVTTIGYSAFEGCDELTSVSLPDSLTDLGAWAFGYCDKLTYNSYNNAKYLGNAKNPYLVLMWAKSTTITQCTVHSKTKILYHYAFEDCYRLTSISIPGKVTSIGCFAFSGCISLKTVTIGSAVKTIYEYAFEDCTSLTSVTVPEGVTFLGHCAFQGCTALKTVKLPTTLTVVETSVFSECTKLTYNTYDNAKYLGNASNKYTVLIQAKDLSITQCQIHPSTKVIAEYAFEDCESLTSISIPDGVITIGDYAFSGCHDLTSVRVPDSAVNIWRYSFAGCLNLARSKYDNALYLGNETNPYHVLLENTTYSITQCQIHPSTKVIADAAFYRCDYLTSLTIPASVAVISDWAFYECYNLEEVHYGGTAAKWRKVNVGDFNDYLLQATFHFAQAPTGDLDGDGDLTSDDAVYLLLHVMFGDEDYPVSGSSPDFDGSGTLDTDDAVYLLMHVMFGDEDYPI